jgi:hypothetical protein
MNFLINFIFSWGYFSVFLFLFYKKILPIISNLIYDYIYNKNNNYKNLLKNINDYSLEYQKKKTFITQLNNDIESLKEKTIIAHQHSQLTAKTLIYNYDKQLKKNKDMILNFYKTQAINKYLNDNENILIDYLKSNSIHYNLNFNLSQDKSSKKILSKQTLLDIDNLW